MPSRFISHTDSCVLSFWGLNDVGQTNWRQPKSPLNILLLCCKYKNDKWSCSNATWQKQCPKIDNNHCSCNWWDFTALIQRDIAISSRFCSSRHNPYRKLKLNNNGIETWGQSKNDIFWSLEPNFFKNNWECLNISWLLQLSFFASINLKSALCQFRTAQQFFSLPVLHNECKSN